MSYCVNINEFDPAKVVVGKIKEFKPNDYLTLKLNKLYYKYDSNVFAELKLLTNFIPIETCKTWAPNCIMFMINSQKLIDIHELLYSKIVESNKKNSDAIKNNVAGNNVAENKNENENKNKNEFFQYKPHVIFKNNKSELKLNPTKKSGFDVYILTKSENINQINRYYPPFKILNKTVHENTISGNFILTISVTDENIKFIIQTGDLKHQMSQVEKSSHITNVYNTKLTIDI